MAGKIDIKKQHKELFAPKRQPHFVNVPSFRYMMIDGEGSPQGTAFQDAIGALYSTAYRTKFRLKADWPRRFRGSPHWSVCGGPMTRQRSMRISKMSGSGR